MLSALRPSSSSLTEKPQLIRRASTESIKSSVAESQPQEQVEENVKSDVKSSFGSNMSISYWLPFLTEWDKRVLTAVTALTFVVRLAFLSHPSVVIFDEVHFGGFANKYINREFFMDLHPPLARLLVTLSAWVGGFKGDFTFYDIGADYVAAKVPYVTMRLFTAVSGVLVVPIAYVMMRSLGVSQWTTMAFSLLTLFDNGLATQSRLILLDSYLVLFTALSGLSWALFQREKGRPFTPRWWASLSLLGLSIGGAASCKWVGLFVVAAVGLYTVSELWNIYGDVSIPITTVAKHFGARAACLIGLPVAFYAFTFWVHFAVLRDHSPAAMSFSVPFQQTLKGGELPGTVEQVHFGSQITLRQKKSEGGYLHSHAHMYPEGSKQQQVTTYHHRDDNNVFILRKAFEQGVTYVKRNEDERESLQVLKNGDRVRLEHASTGRFIHSHNVQAPLSEKDHHFEISAYGHNPEKFSDTNDNWRIEIVDDYGNPINLSKKESVKAIRHNIRLVHANLGCVLTANNKPLPDWGFKQGEVTCGRETLKTNGIWTIETNFHPKHDATHPKVSYPKASFLSRFLELNGRMWTTNKHLSADHPFASRPLSWPLLSRGLGFWNGNHVPRTEKAHKRDKDAKAGLVPPAEAIQVDESELAEGNRLKTLYEAKFRSSQIYLLGNPLVWWTTTAAVAIFTFGLFLNRFLGKVSVRYPGLQASSLFHHVSSFYTSSAPSGFLFLSWMLHWVPFFGMERQLFLHHYLPALFFAIVLAALQFDRLCTLGRVSEPIKRIILCALVLASVAVFVAFMPLGYGLKMTKGHCKRLKWLARWDFDCDSLLDSLSQK